jgi:hypothetical protein
MKSGRKQVSLKEICSLKNWKSLTVKVLEFVNEQGNPENRKSLAYL